MLKKNLVSHQRLINSNKLKFDELKSMNLKELQVLLDEEEKLEVEQENKLHATTD